VKRRFNSIILLSLLGSIQFSVCLEAVKTRRPLNKQRWRRSSDAPPENPTGAIATKSARSAYATELNLPKQPCMVHMRRNTHCLGTRPITIPVTKVQHADIASIGLRPTESLNVDTIGTQTKLVICIRTKPKDDLDNPKWPSGAGLSVGYNCSQVSVKQPQDTLHINTNTKQILRARTASKKLE